MGCMVSLDLNQSARVTKYTTREILPGPGFKWYCPCYTIDIIPNITLRAEQYLVVSYKNMRPDGDLIEHVSGPTIYRQIDPFATVFGPLDKKELSSLEYTICTNHKTGDKHVVQGPILYMPLPYEIVGRIEKKISLLNNQFVVITDNITGHIRILSGPMIYTPLAFDIVGQIKNKIELSNTEYVICTDGKNGEKSVVEGPCLYTPKEYEEVSAIISKIILKNNQYCYIKDTRIGSVTAVDGPKVFALTPFEESSEIFEYITLNYSQYLFVFHRITGNIRIEKGPSRLMLSPFEEIIIENREKIRKALTADTYNAIHIRDKLSGTEELITTPQMYFPPSPNILVIGLRELIRLAPYERMVIMDKESNLIFRSGEESNGFFLPPFCLVLSQEWTLGFNHDKIKITKFDCRFHDMDFKFNVRTNDNVEIEMMVNIYWTIKDFEKMIKNTNDPPQDICNQIRSQILNISSKLSTKDLMEYSSLELIKTVLEQDADFCSSRGIQIVRINITEKKCADKHVDTTFRAVIEQKINRVKILESQRGENDKRIAEIEGLIQFESENFKLLEKRMANMQMQNETHGKAEGQKLHMFFEGLGHELNSAQKLLIFKELQRTERIKVITDKVNELYLSPEDVDFKLDTTVSTSKSSTKA